MTGDERAGAEPPSDGDGPVMLWAAAAVILALVCAGLIGVNLARWQDSRNEPPAEDSAPAPASDRL